MFEFHEVAQSRGAQLARRQDTVQNLVDETRSQLDEQNSDGVDDTRDILPSLNRGLDYAASFLALRYPEPFLVSESLDLVSGVQEYDMPEQAFEDRVLKVELLVSGNYEEVRRVSYYDATYIESSGESDRPVAYLITGRKLRFLPAPTGIYNARIWYMRQPEQLVLPQGRITVYNQPNNYIVVDSVGGDLSSEVDQLNSYINLVDAQTGLIKWTGQIQLLEDNNITFRTSPLRASVLNRTVDGSLPTTAEALVINLDDLICNIRGTCVVEFGQPLRNFLIQFATSEITRKLGGDAPTEEQILAKFEKQIGLSSSGRENTRRIQKRSSSWPGRPNRRVIIQS